MKWSLLIMLPLLAGAAFSATDADGVALALDRSTAELTASLLLGQLREDVLAGEPDGSALVREMAGDPGRYADPAAAKTLLQTIYRQGIADRYHEAAGRYLDRLAGDGGRAALFDNAFLSEALSLPDEALDGVVVRTYAGVFADARKTVCRGQAETLVADIRPTEAEFEATPRAELMRTLTRRVAEAQRQPVFEENLAYISEAIVTPMLDAAEEQRKTQRVFIESEPVDDWSPASIARTLSQGLVRHVAAAAADPVAEGRVTYGVFPSVVSAIPAVAQTRAVGRIRRMADELPVDLDEAALFSVIAANPADHRTEQASLAAFEPTLEARVGADVLARCQALVPSEEWVEFESFARAALAAGPLRQAVSARVRKELLPKVQAAREACARQQAAAWFAVIMEDRWHPSGERVDAVYALADYRKALRGWRDIPELADVAAVAAEQPLMDETARLLDHQIVVLFDRGRMAQTRQHRIVDEAFDGFKTELGGEPRLPDMTVLVERYRRRVRSVWDVERDGVLWGEADAPRPVNAAEQHAALFPSTEERIELRVRSLLESLEQALQETTPEAEPVDEAPPEETEAEADVPEEPEEVVLTGRFELDQRGSDIVLAVHVDAARIAAVACPHAPARYRREYAQTVDRAVSALVSEMMRRSADGPRITLAVEIIVRNDLVYHGIVARLADALNEQAGFLSESGVQLELSSPVME